MHIYFILSYWKMMLYIKHVCKDTTQKSYENKVNECQLRVLQEYMNNRQKRQDFKDQYNIVSQITFKDI